MNINKVKTMDSKQDNSQADHPVPQTGPIPAPTAPTPSDTAPWLQSFTTPKSAQTPEASTPTVAPAESITDLSALAIAESQPSVPLEISPPAAQPHTNDPAPDDKPAPPAPPTPMKQPDKHPSSASHKTPPHHSSSSKAPMIIIIILILIVGSVAMAIAFHKKAPAKTTTATKTKETVATPIKPDAVAPTITATPQELATEFIRANQNGNKTLADNLMSAKMKAGLKEATKSESYYDYCKNDQFCGSLKWVKIDNSIIVVSDDKLPDGSAVKVVKYDIATTTNNTKSTNTIRISVSANGTSWQVEDVEQSFSGAFSNK
ncbi:MAG: hypothetical protein JWO47_66 [Candidatus Saccharibacteria bacterium]|nr:hypothetical protein [Candidatus Saccharibacteria bacterium]